jgi:hypothetical protein
MGRRAYWKCTECNVHLSTAGCGKNPAHHVTGPEFLDTVPTDLRLPQSATTRRNANIVHDPTVRAPAGGDAFYRPGTNFNIVVKLDPRGNDWDEERTRGPERSDDSFWFNRNNENYHVTCESARLTKPHYTIKALYYGAGHGQGRRAITNKAEALGILEAAAKRNNFKIITR